MNYDQIFILLSAATNVVLIIAVFRRRPPIDEEFVKWTALRVHCEQNHKPVRSDEQLQKEFVTRREWEMAGVLWIEMRKDIKRLLGRTAQFATTDEIEGEG